MTAATFMFPQARADQMAEDAVSFQRSGFRLDGRTIQWKFHGGVWHADAAESAFIARQLEYMRQGVIEASYPELIAQTLFPYNTSVPAGAEFYTATHSDQVGEVKIARDMRGIIPRSDVNLTQTTFAIFSMLSSYGYNIQETRAAMMAGFPLDTTRAMNCREQLQRVLDNIAFIGDVPTGIKGALTLANTTTYTVPSTGVAGSKTWASKSPDNVLLDLNGAPAQIVTDTLGSEEPDTMLLPRTTYEHIAGRRVGDGTSTSILSYFKANNAHIKTVAQTHKSESHATAWTGKRGMVYRKNPNKLEIVVPVPFEQFAPGTSESGLEVVTVCHIRTAGAVAHKPKSVGYFDGI